MLKIHVLPVLKFQSTIAMYFPSYQKCICYKKQCNFISFSYELKRWVECNEILNLPLGEYFKSVLLWEQVWDDYVKVSVQMQNVVGIYS